MILFSERLPSISARCGKKTKLTKLMLIYQKIAMKNLLSLNAIHQCAYRQK
jgi:hypothetical protein